MDETPRRMTAKPSWLIGQVAAHAYRLANDGFASVGSRGYHYRVLAALDEFGPASQADVGRRAAMDRSDVVATLNELAGEGCVERTPDPEDRRRNIVTLTKEGARQLKRIDQALGKVQDDLLAPLAEDEREALRGMLTRLLVHHRQA